jgi:hypothetical protein
VVPGIEAAVGVIDGKFVDTSKEIALGLAANYLSYDPDGLYFFNHFITPYIFTRFYTPLCEVEQARLSSNEPYEKSFIVLQCAADYETIYQSAVRFVIISEGFEACAGYPAMWRPVPAEITAQGSSFLLRTGKIPPGKKCAVILGFEGPAKAFTAELNGVAIEEFEQINMDFIEGIGYQPKAVVPEKTICYRAAFDEQLLNELVQRLVVKAKEGSRILNWVEMNVY